ncbi:leucine-rich repeat-containing protein 56 [Contarinia nasturtii]|uniref:leucine-rich repeat-containing protein 56 n=1 Tax=Contarinia nasturtii TaxID=265458 RepID=UPI0012D4A77D|nr:leucine-rich repeat-containing protein 56 [Contarinia nasturtii]
MPNNDIPADEIEDANSSLSFSSNENGSVSNRSMASSMSIGLNNSSPPLIANGPRQRQIYSPISTNFIQPIYPEPTLDAVLRKACGTTADLETLTHIQMRVSSNIFGLHQMHIFMPNLVALNLDGSSLESLRDLGCDLKIKYLNVSRCGLRSFNGISGFDTVEHLVADGNEISNVMQLGGALPELHTLSLRSNRIKQLNVIAILSMCTTLTSLDLTNNVITNTIDYRQNVKTAIPNLLILDGFGFDEMGANTNLTECSSSLTSDISKDSSSISEANLMSRPLSSRNQFIDTILTDSTGRPSTAESSSICSGGSPIVGNIINKVRRKRREKANDTNKQSDSSSASLSSLLDTNSRNATNSSNFPMTLPQTSVSLELGLINTEPAPQSEASVHQLIEMCRRWRVLSQKSRQKFNSNSK